MDMDSDISRCINNWFPVSAQQTLAAQQSAPFKQEMNSPIAAGNNTSRLINHCEDSGFLTCNSSQSSPQLSPISNGSYTRMDGAVGNGSPFDEYPQLSFQGVASSANWSLSLNDAIIPTRFLKEIRLFSNYPSKSSDGSRELRIVKQPECHHRARYMTEGSRGTIKDRTGRSYPAIQLLGYNKGHNVKLQCFIGHDSKLGDPHLFYQACEVSGKTPYRMSKVDGINMIEMEMTPKNQYQTVLDCMGILKERNVDVERKVLRSRRKTTNRTTTASEEAKVIRSTNKARSTHCCIVFRCQMPDTGEILQAISEPILCTQPLGSPEIYKMSSRESDIKGGHELFIIGKNFHKDSKVVFTNGTQQHPVSWRKVVQPMKEFLNNTHIVCHIPVYDCPDAKYQSMINVDITVHCDHKSSEPMKFIYTNHLHQQQQQLHQQQQQQQQHSQQQHPQQSQQQAIHCNLNTMSSLMRQQQQNRGKHMTQEMILPH